MWPNMTVGLSYSIGIFLATHSWRKGWKPSSRHSWRKGWRPSSRHSWRKGWRPSPRHSWRKGWRPSPRHSRIHVCTLSQVPFLALHAHNKGCGQVRPSPRQFWSHECACQVSLQVSSFTSGVQLKYYFW